MMRHAAPRALRGDSWLEAVVDDTPHAQTQDLPARAQVTRQLRQERDHSAPRDGHYLSPTAAIAIFVRLSLYRWARRGQRRQSRGRSAHCAERMAGTRRPDSSHASACAWYAVMGHTAAWTPRRALCARILTFWLCPKCHFDQVPNRFKPVFGIVLRCSLVFWALLHTPAAMVTLPPLCHLAAILTHRRLAAYPRISCQHTACCVPMWSAGGSTAPRRPPRSARPLRYARVGH